MSPEHLPTATSYAALVGSGRATSAGTSRSRPSFKATTATNGPAPRNAGAIDPAIRKPTPRALSVSRASPSAGRTCRKRRLSPAALDDGGNSRIRDESSAVERCLDRDAVCVDHPHPDPVGCHLDEDLERCDGALDEERDLAYPGVDANPMPEQLGFPAVETENE